MKRTLLTLSAILCAVSPVTAQLPPDSENPGSLFPKSFKNPFMDRTAKAEGDIVTILISESSLASFAASTTSSKKDQNSVSKILGPALFGGLWPNLGTSASGSTDGKGQTNQTSRLSARMAALVKKVLPNGNMIIEGVRQVRVNKETQAYLLTGTIRPDDIQSNNTILSENIAEAEIKLDGKGKISESTRRGIITRIIDWLF